MAVVITVLVKNVKQENLKIDFKERQVAISLNLNEQQYNREYNLSHKIVPEQCSYKITPSKVVFFCFVWFIVNVVFFLF